MVEKIGAGFFRIKKALAEYGMEGPIIEANEDWFSTTFKRVEPGTAPNETVNGPVNRPINGPVNEPVKLTDLQQELLTCIAKNPKITYSEMLKILNKGRTTIKKNIQELKDADLIQRIGSDKSGHWKVIQNEPVNRPVNGPVNEPVELTDLQEELLTRIEENPEITYSEMATILKKGKTTIKRNIQQLKDANLLQRIGSDRFGRWKVI